MMKSGNLLLRKRLKVSFALFFIPSSILLSGNQMLPSRTMMPKPNMVDQQGRKSLVPNAMECHINLDHHLRCEYERETDFSII